MATLKMGSTTVLTESSGTVTLPSTTTFTGNVTLSGTANSLGNGYTHIETLTASGSSLMHIEDCFTSTYTNYLLQVTNYKPNADGEANKILLSTGGTVNTGAYYWYTWAGIKTSDGSDYRVAGRDIAYVYMNPNTGNNETGASGTWFIHAPNNSALYTMANGVGSTHHSSEYQIGGAHSFGWRGITSFDGIQLAPATSSIIDGAKMTVYGINGS